MAQLNFDASQVKPIGDNEALPAGWYPVRMTASEQKPIAAGDGSYLECEFTVTGGDFDGRKVFDRLNLGNKNPAAVEIAYRKLSAICHSVGVIQVQDSAQLHDRMLMVKVAVRPAVTAEQSGDGKAHDASNEIKGYKSMNDAGAESQPQAAAPVPADAPAPAATPAPAFTPPAFGAAPAPKAATAGNAAPTPPWKK